MEEPEYVLSPGTRIIIHETLGSPKMPALNSMEYFR